MRGRAQRLPRALAVLTLLFLALWLTVHLQVAHLDHRAAVDYAQGGVSDDYLGRRASTAEIAEAQVGFAWLAAISGALLVVVLLRTATSRRIAKEPSAV